MSAAATDPAMRAPTMATSTWIVTGPTLAHDGRGDDVPSMAPVGGQDPEVPFAQVTKIEDSASRAAGPKLRSEMPDP